MNRFFRLLSFSIGAMSLLSAAAWAQQEGRIPDEDGGTMQWLMAVAILVVVCAPAAINAKRSHLD